MIKRMPGIGYVEPKKWPVLSLWTKHTPEIGFLDKMYTFNRLH